MRIILLLALLPLTALAQRTSPDWLLRSDTGIVASDSPEASQAGADILSAGGNAFDAAITTALALGVARPHSCGLGGGGFMVAYLAETKECIALDFRETAPQGATPNVFAQQTEDGHPLSLYGGHAIGTPGQLPGLLEIHRRYATRPFAELVEPAAQIAENGFVVDKSLLSARRSFLERRKRWTELQKVTEPLSALLQADGELAPGTKLKRPALAAGLRRIAQDPQGAWDGPLGDAFIAAAKAAGGTLSRADLNGYEVKQRTPVRGRYLDYEIVSMPPPSSGGVALIETLNILAAAQSGEVGQSAALRSHHLVEAMKHAFADRARWMGDPDFNDIPVERLISKEYARETANRISSSKTGTTESYGTTAPPPDDAGTSHFSVADRFGNVVAITQTINGSFGSYIVAEPFGIILNNEIDDFLTVPGKANLYGLQQSERNLVRAGRRPLSSMTPTIIFRDNRPFLTLGASGGPRIITSVLNVSLFVMHGWPLGKSITKARPHHQWLPNSVFFDQTPPESLSTGLKAFGHEISDRRQTGIVQAIRFTPDGAMEAASDPRKGGKPAKPDR